MAAADVPLGLGIGTWEPPGHGDDPASAALLHVVLGELPEISQQDARPAMAQHLPSFIHKTPPETESDQTQVILTTISDDIEYAFFLILNNALRFGAVALLSSVINLVGLLDSNKLRLIPYLFIIAATARISAAVNGEVNTEPFVGCWGEP
eukprot:Skav210501  [mRNA]  locus=scaffold601:371443:373118:+ [translate_table: standard]